MNSRERFLAAVSCEVLDRPPIWVMRQADRYLPEYRELKARSSFLEMVRTPALAAEVTLQPIRRFPGIDAAILFSDILVIPEALGQPYAFRDDGGIAMDHRIKTRAQVDALAGADSIPDRLSYVAEALALVKKELDGSKALLGFGGSPWWTRSAAGPAAGVPSAASAVTSLTHERSAHVCTHRRRRQFSARTPRQQPRPGSARCGHQRRLGDQPHRHQDQAHCASQCHIKRSSLRGLPASAGIGRGGRFRHRPDH